MKYTIRFEVKEFDGSTYLAIPIVETMQETETLGDMIGIYKDGNIIELSDFIDVDDADVREFAKTYFKDYRAVLGFIRKITEV